MIALRDWTKVNRAGVLVLAGALVWTLAAGVQAVLLEPLPMASPPAVSSPAYLHSRPEAAVLTSAILATVHGNPMRPDRQRAEGRYGQNPVSEIAEPEQRAPVPAFQVVGIVRRRSGPDLAAIAWDRSPSQLVRLGSEIQGFTLNRIRADSIFLARPDTAIGLPVPGPRYWETGR